MNESVTVATQRDLAPLGRGCNRAPFVRSMKKCPIITRRGAMDIKTGIFCLIVLDCALFAESAHAMPTPHQTEAKTEKAWRTFTSRSGWSVSYPADWTDGSCNSCSDPAAPDMFVGFYPPKNKSSNDDIVMIEPLAGRHAKETVDQWLDDIKTSANQNPIIGQGWTSVNGARAFTVRYRYADSSVGDTVYIMNGSKMFALSGPPISHAADLQIYKNMVASFRFVSPADVARLHRLRILRRIR